MYLKDEKENSFASRILEIVRRDSMIKKENTILTYLRGVVRVSFISIFKNRSRLRSKFITPEDPSFHYFFKWKHR